MDRGWLPRRAENKTAKVRISAASLLQVPLGPPDFQSALTAVKSPTFSASILAVLADGLATNPFLNNYGDLDMELCNYITLTQATKLLPNQPHASAVWRWCRQGIKTRNGDLIKLHHVRIGGRLVTTERDLKVFFESVAESDAKYFDRPVPTYPRPRNVQSDQARRRALEADAELRVRGI